MSDAVWGVPTWLGVALLTLLQVEEIEAAVCFRSEFRRRLSASSGVAHDQVITLHFDDSTGRHARPKRALGDRKLDFVWSFHSLIPRRMKKN